MEELADVLRQERHHLEVLLYRLTATRLLLQAREVRFLHWSSQEVERARQRTREVDLLRAANVQLLGVRGLHGQAPTLRQLASLASVPWAGILRDHHDAMAALVAEIEVVAHQTGELARDGIRSVADAQESADRGSTKVRSTTSRRRAVTGAEHRPAAPAPTISTWRALPFEDDGLPDDGDLSLLSTESAYQEALKAAGKLKIPSLLAFLR